MSNHRQKWAAFEAEYRADRAQRTGKPFTPRDARFESLFALAVIAVGLVNVLAFVALAGGAR